MEKYAIGLDYGTLSARGVVVNVKTGEIVASAAADYPHGVITDCLPGTKITLKEEWALQHPEDYLQVFFKIVSVLISESVVSTENIIGLGVGFTSCTILPIDNNGVPLCLKAEFKENPHSYVKLWKHHAAQSAADCFNETYHKSEESFLELYGGKISSEWMFPKLMQVKDESPMLYDEAAAFIEAGDWLVLKLTGNLKRNACAAGFKANWNKRRGYPGNEFLKKVGLDNIVEEKLSGDIFPPGSFAGYLTAEMAKKSGLPEKTAIAAASVDAHAAFPGMGMTSPGKMVMIVGTSTCNITISEKEIKIPGISGVVEDGVIPGYFGYEAGQAAVGDIFDWFIKNCVPDYYFEEATSLNISIFDLLTHKAAKLKPGETGLLSLDWWNGNRTVLNDASLSGVIVGLTLSTRPEEVYRALIEATAFGQLRIVEAFKEAGIKLDELYACGGITQKNNLLMQVYADVMDMEIKVSSSPNVVALGSAMFAAVAAGKDSGGYDSISDAANAMAGRIEKVFESNQENHQIYQELYKEYKKLYNYFGRVNQVMKILKNIKTSYSD